jgi:MFS family permease
MDDTRRSLAWFNINAGLRLWYDNIAGITGFIFVGYALALGVDKEKIGYLASIASLACFVQLAGLLAANAIRDKKRVAILMGYLEPAFYMGMVVAVYFAPPVLRLPIIGLGVLLSATSLHFVRPIMDEWLASTIPEHIRGRYLSRRMLIVSIISIAAMLIMGYAAEHLKGLKGFEAKGYGALLLAGGVFGLLAVQSLWRISMPAISAGARLSWSAVPEVLSHRPFIRYVTATLIYNLPFWLAAPYYQVFHLKVLNLGEQAISYMMIGYFIIKIIALPFAGRWLDRLGPRSMIYLVSPLYVIFFLLYTLGAPERWWTVFAAWAVIGVAEAGFSVAATSALYSSVPETSSRQAYFAFYNMLSFLFAAMGSATAAWTLGRLEHAEIVIGTMHLGQFQLLYGISFLMIIPCILGTRLYPGKEQSIGKKPAEVERDVETDA